MERAQRPGWLRVDRLLGEWGIHKDSPAGRAQLAGLMETRRRQEGLGAYEPRGWYLGGEAFRDELLAQVQHQAGPRHVGQEVYQSAEAKAERIVHEELEALRWSALDLERRRKGDPAKLKIADGPTDPRTRRLAQCIVNLNPQSQLIPSSHTFTPLHQA